MQACRHIRVSHLHSRAANARWRFARGVSEKPVFNSHSVAEDHGVAVLERTHCIRGPGWKLVVLPVPDATEMKLAIRFRAASVVFQAPICWPSPH